MGIYQVEKNSPGKSRGGWSKRLNGEAGIRTPDTGLTPYNGLANRRLQPLGHLSKRRYQLWAAGVMTQPAFGSPGLNSPASPSASPFRQKTAMAGGLAFIVQRTAS